MNTTVIAAYRFETLVRTLLEVNKFEVKEVGDSPAGKHFDYIAVRGGESWAVEIKYYRTLRAQGSLLNAAAIQLVAGGKEQTKNGMLVVSCDVPPALSRSIQDKFSITVIGRNELMAWAANQPTLIDELNALLEDDSSELRRRIDQTTVQITDRPFSSGPSPDIPTRGAELCQQLHALPPGRDHARNYELLCIEITKYLFPNELIGWHDQYSTTDGLNRYDCVCRIKATTDFWKFLVRHLESQYVLFGFKNYSERIKQGQVLTTEKYLLEKALRKVAIIFSRFGPNNTAKTMAQGAMREHGKLMLMINDDFVCGMLHHKDAGSDPSDLLFGLADEFLMTLPR